MHSNAFALLLAQALLNAYFDKCDIKYHILIETYFLYITINIS